jgi:uncharacterized protein (TIGR02284 family)
MNTITMDYPVMDRTFDDAAQRPPGGGNDVCEALAEAIEVLRDSEKGFRQAAEHVSMEHLRHELMSYAGQRALFVGELQDLERDYGRMNVNDTGTVTGALHRAWVGLKTAVTRRSNRAILGEVAAGEKAAADFYVEMIATRRGLPLQVKQCLSRHCAELQKGQFELSDRCASCVD